MESDFMRTKTLYIADDGMEFNSILDCEKYEKELEQQAKAKSEELSDSFLLSIGFDVRKYETKLEKNQVLNLTWLIFDKYGNIIGLKTSGGGLLERYGIKCDFRYVSGDDEDNSEIMENWLRKNKLYEHALSSFSNRNLKFYQLSMIEKLENLGWEIENGKIVNAAW